MMQNLLSRPLMRGRTVLYILVMSWTLILAAMTPPESYKWVAFNLALLLNWTATFFIALVVVEISRFTIYELITLLQMIRERRAAQ
jgi:hypothetical protein